MKYAIVDIETTGGHASIHRIIEIAIVISDGTQVLESYETLIDPDRDIPTQITGLTGITNDDILGAPPFRQVADIISEKLEGCIFVAHSVNFDYSFVKHELSLCNIDFKAKKLCTVRLSRSIFPGHRSYSLGHICVARNIQIEDRHRAMGDAKATAELFHQLVAADEGNYIQKSLNPQSKEQTLPPNISKQQFDALPEETGVYYFYNAINKIVYIGKAVNIKKRVSQHFTKDLKSNQRQSFMRDIHGIGHEITGNELMALLHESSEIQKHWPMYNRALKRLNFRYGIFSYTGNDGYTRIGVDRLRKNARPLQVYDHLSDGFQALQQLLNQYSLCANKCIFQQHDAIEPCGDSCSCKQGTEVYNSQVSEALDWLKNAYENYYIYGKGRHEGESSVVSVKQGSYSAYGYITEEINMHVPLEDQLKPAPVNTAAMSIIQSFVEHPQYRIVRYA